jgi:Ca2+-binding EF-hand superfamily protein
VRAQGNGPEEQDTRTTAPVVAPAPAVTAVPPTVHPLSDFATLDANHDGRISSAEYARAAQSLFEMIDMEHDGTVTLQELEAARGVLGDLDGLDPKRILALADADQDGKLTLGEWMAFNNARFDRIDANDDGFIDRAEWNAPHPAPPEPSAIPEYRRRSHPPPACGRERTCAAGGGDSRCGVGFRHERARPAGRAPSVSSRLWPALFGFVGARFGRGARRFAALAFLLLDQLRRGRGQFEGQRRRCRLRPSG